MGVLPFMFFAQKARYRVIADNSPAASEVAAVADRLASAVGDLQARVEWVQGTGADSVAGSVAAAATRGHRRIVVAQLFVAEPPQMEFARSEIDALRLGDRASTCATPGR